MPSYPHAPSSFGVRVREARLRTSYSCRDLSLASGNSITFVNQIENGYTLMPNIRRAKAIADVLNVPLRWLVAEEDDVTRRAAERLLHEEEQARYRKSGLARTFPPKAPLGPLLSYLRRREGPSVVRRGAGFLASIFFEEHVVWNPPRAPRVLPTRRRSPALRLVPEGETNTS